MFMRLYKFMSTNSPWSTIARLPKSLGLDMLNIGRYEFQKYSGSKSKIIQYSKLLMVENPFF